MSLALVTEDGKNDIPVGRTIACVIDKGDFDRIRDGVVVNGRLGNDLRMDVIELLQRRSRDLPRLAVSLVSGPALRLRLLHRSPVGATEHEGQLPEQAPPRERHNLPRGAWVLEWRWSPVWRHRPGGLGRLPSHGPVHDGCLGLLWTTSFARNVSQVSNAHRARSFAAARGIQLPGALS